jgi:hypothetical protein
MRPRHASRTWLGTHMEEARSRISEASSMNFNGRRRQTTAGWATADDVDDACSGKWSQDVIMKGQRWGILVIKTRPILPLDST